MSSPREAIYDVLQAQRQRAIDLSRSRAQEEWEQYEAQNAAADADYRRRQEPQR